ncbi:MAG: YkgJ family cysteine cluster protein [Gammaproteobacteria bacterium]|nr:YkgJ family cysteine cluster protein [Gammaproteobacteria bacterium]
MSDITPCNRCGACCAAYRVSFYWAEAAPELGDAVPLELTEKVSPTLLAMQGTWDKTPRCIALRGEVGAQTACSIYPSRPSTCRELQYSWQHGQPNERCDQARAAWNLPPLSSLSVWGQSKNSSP